MAKREVDVLAEGIDKTRELTRFYLSKLKRVDEHKQFEFDGKRFNSVYWLIAHITWAECMLPLKATGGPNPEIVWLSAFKIGTDPEDGVDGPDFAEVLHQFKRVHHMALDHVRSLTDDQLDLPNLTGVMFGGEDTFRMVIQHTARHEGMHTGHLGWLCKMHGVETV